MVSDERPVNEAKDRPASGEPEAPTPAAPAAAAAAARPAAMRPGFLRRHWGPVALASVVLVPALIFVAWAWIALTFSYSEGERAGWVQKFSRKGWVCKTWEGELAQVNLPGAAPVVFPFSVRDEAVASEILRHMGERVSIRYEQHVGVPTRCFGETQYFVTSVHRVPGP